MLELILRVLRSFGIFFVIKMLYVFWFFCIMFRSGCLWIFFWDGDGLEVLGVDENLDELGIDEDFDWLGKDEDVDVDGLVKDVDFEEVGVDELELVLFKFFLEEDRFCIIWDFIFNLFKLVVVCILVCFLWIGCVNLIFMFFIFFNLFLKKIKIVINYIYKIEVGWILYEYLFRNNFEYYKEFYLNNI